jgi:hypothetical protein
MNEQVQNGRNEEVNQIPEQGGWETLIQTNTCTTDPVLTVKAVDHEESSSSSLHRAGN